MAVSPWRGVGMGVRALHRLAAASKTSTCPKVPVGASPPKTNRRDPRTAAAIPLRGVGRGGRAVQPFVAGS